MIVFRTVNASVVFNIFALPGRACFWIMLLHAKWASLLFFRAPGGMMIKLVTFEALDNIWLGIILLDGAVTSSYEYLLFLKSLS